ncbi:MAG: QueT transporter family protein [Oscillospiraceae bacterium]|nr:QueT transporter family protein [Oscillospiraceae bacterium]
MMKKISPKDLSRCSMMAALYAAVSIVLLPISFGAVQVRLSEALTILPVYTPLGVWGVTLGCLITNAYGVSVGANILGAADIVIGTAATLVAALMTRWLRNFRIKGMPIAATIPPIVVNAVVIGAELTFAETGKIFSPLLWINMFQVGLGQLIACTVGGSIVAAAIERCGLDKTLF